jgi:hypothetical protein
LYLIGGCNYNLGRCLTDVWQFDPTTFNFVQIKIKTNFEFNESIV